MNLNIDITNARQLRQARDELTRLLNIVEYAIRQNATGGTKPEEVDQLQLQTTNGHTNLSVEAPVMEVIKSLPEHFSTTDIIVALGDKGKDSRSAVKMVLKRAVNTGRLRLISKGIGRRPSQYAKSA
jgi:hypothetical protein